MDAAESLRGSYEAQHEDFTILAAGVEGRAEKLKCLLLFLLSLRETWG